MDYPTCSFVDSGMKVVRHTVSWKSRIGTFLRSGRKPQRGASSALRLDGFGSRLIELPKDLRKLLIEVNLMCLLTGSGAQCRGLEEA
jgi:hypothetical protein